MNLLALILQKSHLDYHRFLEHTIDARSVGEFVLLYGQSMIEERNQTYELERYLPGWFTIGDDSGGVALLMNLDGSDGVYQCDQGALGSLEPERFADSFQDWLNDECPTPWNDD